MVLICSLWGDGGILVHELSHAYHNKFCPNGFNCREILGVLRMTLAASYTLPTYLDAF